MWITRFLEIQLMSQIDTHPSSGHRTWYKSRRLAPCSVTVKERHYCNLQIIVNCLLNQQFITIWTFRKWRSSMHSTRFYMCLKFRSAVLLSLSSRSATTRFDRHTFGKTQLKSLACLRLQNLCRGGSYNNHKKVDLLFPIHTNAILYSLVTDTTFKKLTSLATIIVKRTYSRVTS